MTQTPPSVTLVRRIKAEPAKVYAAITRPELMLQCRGARRWRPRPICGPGAVQHHLSPAERRCPCSDRLMPADPRDRSEVKEWLFAALASVEAASQPWSFFKFAGGGEQNPMWTFLEGFLNKHRLPHLEPVLTGRE